MTTALADDVYEAVEDFMARLSQIAKDHKRCVLLIIIAASSTSHNDP